MTNRDEYITGLRELADWLEKHPEVATPDYVADISVPLMDNASVEAYAAAAGLDVAYDADGNASADIAFGPITYRAYGYADWETWIKQQHAKRAHSWADAHGMNIVPADTEGGQS